jgi:hypothetical protein
MQDMKKNSKEKEPKYKYQEQNKLEAKKLKRSVWTWFL